MKTKFAWIPVPLSVCVGKLWRETGKIAWLKRVRVVTNIWGDKFYVELPPNA